VVVVFSFLKLFSKLNSFIYNDIKASKNLDTIIEYPTLIWLGFFESESSVRCNYALIGLDQLARNVRLV